MTSVACETCRQSKTPANNAASLDHIDCLRVVLNKQNINKKDEEGFTPLIRAAQKGHLEIVCFLLNSGLGCQINAEDHFGRNAIHHGLSFVEIVVQLISSGISAKATDNEGISILHKAALTGNIEILQIILSLFPDVNVKDQHDVTPLHIASQQGHENVVSILIKAGAKVNAVDDKGNTPLHKAAFNGYRSIVRTLLGNNAPIDAKNKEGMTPLHLAAERSAEEVCSFLITKGAQIDAKSLTGITPLHKAILSGSLTICQLLIDKKANIDSQDQGGKVLPNIFPCIQEEHSETKRGYAPVHLAAYRGNVQLFQFLVHRGANIYAKGIHGLTPTMIACLEGRAEIVNSAFQSEGKKILQVKDDDGAGVFHKAAVGGDIQLAELLKEEGELPNEKDNYGLTPFHLACFYGQQKFAKFLVENKAEIEAKDIFGATPLHMACMNNQKKIIKYLIRKKVKIDTQDNEGETALHWACFYGFKKCVRKLLEYGADVHALNRNEATPMHSATSGGNLDCMKILVEKGAKVTVSDMDGVTPILVSCQQGNIDNFKYILANGGDISATDNKKNSPLHFAAANGRAELVKLLCYKQPVDFCNSENATPLHVAAYNGKLDCIQILIKQGANVNAVDDEKCTPLHKCCFNGFVDCAEHLVKKGCSISAKDKSGHTSLHFSALKGNSGCLERLLELGAPADSQDMVGCTSLHLASIYGHSSCVSALLAKGASVDCKDKDGNTPLHFAAKSGINEVIITLVKKGGNLLAKNSKSETPLAIALEEESTETQKILTDLMSMQSNSKEVKKMGNSLPQKKFYATKKARNSVLQAIPKTQRKNPVILLLIDILLDSNHTLANALCNSVGIASDGDKVAFSILKLHNPFGGTISLIKRIVSAEINSTKMYTVLFRGNSMASKMLFQFAMDVGRSYLLDTLKAPINHLCKNISYLEIDPEKASEHVLASNHQALIRTINMFLDSIFASVDNCPNAIRDVSYFLKVEVEKKFPGSGTLAVGIRFMNPYIVSPETLPGLTTVTVDSNIRKYTVLVSKILQQLANGITNFRDPKQYIVNAVDPIVQARFKDFQGCLEAISNTPSNYDPEYSFPASNMEICSALNQLLKCVQNDHLKIVKQLEEEQNNELIEAIHTVVKETPTTPLIDLNTVGEEAKSNSVIAVRKKKSWKVGATQVSTKITYLDEI